MMKYMEIGCTYIYLKIHDQQDSKLRPLAQPSMPARSTQALELPRRIRDAQSPKAIGLSALTTLDVR